MDSDLHHHHYGSHQQQHKQQHQQQQNMINSNMYSDNITPLFNPQISRFAHLMNSKKQQQMMYQNLSQSQEIIHNNTSIVASSSSAARLLATNLLRQSSSPAGFFEHVNTDNGYSIMGSLDKSGHANLSVPDSSFSPRLNMNTPMDFLSGSHSSSRLTSHIPVGYELSSLLTDGFMKETDRISSCEIQIERKIHGPTSLTHQLSLPTSSTELSAMENLLQFQDTVPLRSRAKRGCATHPRSIAERVRRTRISERMKKLQDLVPNMDKQTSISDMLDLALDYIKNLQNHVETLADHHAKCRCPNKRKL